MIEIKLPNSITTIEQNAFYGCCSLDSIEIPHRVSRIEYRAFYGCKSLENIIIPENVEIIEEEAFIFCSSLKNLVISGEVIKISEGVFYGCDSLTSLHMKSTKPENIDISNLSFEMLLPFDSNINSNSPTFDKCKLFVPSGTRWAYRHHPVFGKFKNIEIEP